MLIPGIQFKHKVAMGDRQDRAFHNQNTPIAQFVFPGCIDFADNQFYYMTHRKVLSA